MAKKVGRRTKLTPDSQEIIIGHIKKGLANQDAAKLAGIAGTTFYAWLKRGRRETAGKYWDFVVAIEEAEVHWKRALLERLETIHVRGLTERKIVKRQIGDQEFAEVTESTKSAPWTLTAWLLERKFPEEFGKRVVEVQGIDTPSRIEVAFGVDVDHDKPAVKLATKSDGEDES